MRRFTIVAVRVVARVAPVLVPNARDVAIEVEGFIARINSLSRATAEAEFFRDHAGARIIAIFSGALTEAA